MKFHLLKALLWIRCKLRQRQKLITAVDYLSPVLLFLFLYYVKESFVKPQPIHKDSNTRFTEPLLLDHAVKPSMVLYSPESELMKTLMDSVKIKLNKSGRKKTLVKPIAGIQTEAKNLEDNEAIVLFQDMTGDVWPKTLNYSIALKGHFMTHLYTAVDGDPVPHTSFGMIYEPVMRLQWAIDTSYLESLTGKEIKQVMTLQEFPFSNRKRDEEMGVHQFVPLICFIGMMLTSMTLLSTLCNDRVSGLKEWIRMSGVNGTLITVSHILDLLLPSIIFSLAGSLAMTVGSKPLFGHTSICMLFLILWIFYFTILSMAFVLSYITNDVQYTILASCFVNSALYLLASYAAKTTAMADILPNVGLRRLVTKIADIDADGYGLTFINMFEPYDTFGTPALTLFLMILQILLMFLLSWYLDRVRPGPYGQAEPWNFLFKKQFWRTNDIVPQPTEESPLSQRRDPRYFEAPPDAEVGIRIRNVTMKFPGHVALDKVTMDVCKGEITVLLGHNGAGKSTLMAVITGLLTQTSGSVSVAGLDTLLQRDQVRKKLGFCPQYNFYFPELSAVDHVTFFTLLKGHTFSEARTSSEQLLAKLGLHDKLNDTGRTLSGGMKRRLQLACGLAGNAEVLILDEPTSGLDVETRRELWDVLLSLRGNRTVLLTTHFMEEADALGDRVAAIHTGHLTCLATPLYLKKAMGTGYRLTFTTANTPQEAEITAAVTTHVPEAALKECSLKSLSYSLPAARVDRFSCMFNDFEDKKTALGIDSIGLGLSTLEEVFLKLCSDTDTMFASGDAPITEPKLYRISGVPLVLQQMKVLMTRQVQYWFSNVFYFIVVRCAMPILLLVFLSYSQASSKGDQPGINRNTSSLTLDLGVYDQMPSRRVLYDANITEDILNLITDTQPNVTFLPVEGIEDVVLRASQRSIQDYTKYLIGIELNDTDAKILYSTVYRHTAPVGLNLVSNLLAAQLLPWASGRTIEASIEPLDRSTTQVLIQPRSIESAIIWGMSTIYVSFIANMPAPDLACAERLSGARHLHIMAGAPPALPWLAALMAQAMLLVPTVLLPASISAYLFDEDNTFVGAEFVAALCLLLLFSSLALVAFGYLLSFCLRERAVVTILFIFTIGFTLVPVLESFGFKALVDVSKYTASPTTMFFGILKTTEIARENALCNLNRHLCPELVLESQGSLCCETSGNVFSYLSMDSTSAGREVLVLLVQFIVLMLLVWLVEIGMIQVLFEMLLSKSYQPPKKNYNDLTVSDEEQYVKKAMEQEDSMDTSNALLASDLHKRFLKRLTFHPAVRGVSLCIKKGECFGLLGVNGAGKSTTFKMLTAELYPTKGLVTSNGHHFFKQRSKYLHSLGYCPQFFGLDKFLTGHQNLVLLLSLNGLPKEDAKAEADSWIEVLGLAKYAHKKLSQYSGGCMRRLAAGAALCTRPPLALLDEPTAGVDVAARRRVWAALRRALAAKRAALVTSHSMDEMEALCDRIAIMSAGEVCTLGAPAALRAAHARGHAIRLKLKASRYSDETDSPVLKKLKCMVQEKFNCTLKDEHRTMLHYHVNEAMSYGVLFKELEQILAANELLEDYTVTETTLEEVFLSYSTQQDPTIVCEC